MRKTFSAVISFLLFTGSILGQDKENDLDPVVVSTSLTAEKSSATGRNVFVIKGERFASLPVHSIDELLRYLPGIEVQMRGPMGAQSDIVVRGGTFQQVLVILDGMRLNDPNTGHFTSYIPIAPAEIERIELLKGAASAVYGSEAVGGVVYIITKTYAARQGEHKKSAIAQITGGQYDLFSVNAGGTYSDGNTMVSAGILSNNTSGQPQRGTHGSVYTNTGSLSIGHFINEKWQTIVRAAIDCRKFSAQNFYTPFISDTANENVNTLWTQAAISYHGNRNNLSFHAGYKLLEDEYQFNSISLPNKSRSRLLQALITDEWKIAPATRMTTGAQFINKKISSNDRGDHQVNQAAGFIVLNQQFDKLMVSPALRLEWNEKAGWELVPQANLSYRISNFQFRASGGKTIRDADFTERYNNYQKAFVSSGRIGNPDLVAERSFSVEAGADYFAAKAIKISATVFKRYHDRLIDYVLTPYSEMPRKVNLSPSGSYQLAKNISKVRTSGVEMEVQYIKELNQKQRIWTTIGLTWLHSESSDSALSFYIASHAKFLFNFNFQYEAKRWSFSLNGLYKKRQPQSTSTAIAKVSPDYFVLNAKGEVFIIPGRLSLFAEADNVFDRNYTDLLGAQMPGLWLMGGIKISLSK
jgi:vitamin B12 transporter